MRLHRSLIYALFATACHILIQFPIESVSAQEAVQPANPERKCILYRNADDPKNHTVTIASADGGAMSFPFLPFAIQPASIADFVAINHKYLPSEQYLEKDLGKDLEKDLEKDLDMNVEGTYVRLEFDISGDEWVMVPFTPDGRSPSTTLAINLHELLSLTEKMPVYMMLDARTAAGKTANVEFRVGQGPGDNQKYPVVEKVRLTDKW